ncbi:MAG: hypothetical protein ACRDL1_05340 [Solirubrobacterales bacterium]
MIARAPFTVDTVRAVSVQHDYELILGGTDRGFQSVWLVERGSL